MYIIIYAENINVASNIKGKEFAMHAYLHPGAYVRISFSVGM